MTRCVIAVGSIVSHLQIAHAEVQMRKQWFYGLALILITASPSCVKQRPTPQSKKVPPVPATIAPPPAETPAIETPAVVEETPVVEEAPTPVVVAPPVVRRPQRVAMAPKAEVTEQVYIIDEPSNTSATQSQIVEPTVIDGGSLELETPAPERSKVEVDLSLGQILNVDQSDSHETQFSLSVLFPLSPVARLGFAQTLRKQFVPGNNIGGREDLLAEDTRVYFEHLLSRNPVANLKVNVGATLPVSRRSNQSKNATRLSLGFTAEGLLTDSIVVSVAPEIQYFINANQQNESGQPLNRFVIGQGVSIDWNFAESLHWVSWARGYYRFYESANVALARFPGPTTTYAFGTYLQYDFPVVSIQGGFLRGTSLFSDVRTSDVFYDLSPNSRFFVSLSAAF